jgi:electron transfer flavoprotein beta subunit
VTVGGDDDVQALRQALAMGAGNAVRINDEGRAGLGDHAVAALLAAWIRKQEYDLILCGKHAVGSDSNQVPQMLGAMLGLPVMTSITKLEIADGTATGQRAIEGKTEVVTVKLPAVISCDKGLNEPRYPKLKGIMAAKRAKIEEFTAAALGVDDSVLASSSLELESIELPPEKGAGVKVEVGDDPDAAVEKFIEWLKNEAQAL